MLGGVVDLQAICQGFGLFWWKDLVERGGRVGIEVVHQHDHLRGFRIVFFENLLHEERPVFLGALLGHRETPLAR